VSIVYTAVGAFLLTIAFSTSSMAASPREVSVKKTGTKYYGSLDRKNNVVSFKGIRYAQAPEGDLRWAPPVPYVEKNKEVLALRYREECVQLPLVSILNIASGSEDCLFLNIWRPAEVTRKKRAVMVFIHGGAQVIGSSAQNVGSENLYDGTKLSEVGDVLVVTLNYRLGALGFLASSGLSAESKTGTSGNYGLLDQIEALKWINQNISAFGGDPENVTIFGESAGGANVLALIASPEAKGLFHKAITQSGVLYDTELAEAETKGDEFFRSLGCDPGDMDCARKLSAGRMARAMPLNRDGTMPVGPVIDGHVLTEHVLETFGKGEQNQVPLMIGTNEHEMSLLLPIFLDGSWSISEERFKKLIVDTLGQKAFEKIKKEYSIEKYKTYRQALMALLADHHFHLPAQQIVDAIGKSQDSGVWQYVFYHESALGQWTGLDAGHALELPLLFGTLKYTWNDKDHKVSQLLMKTWTNFAKTGNPNSKGEGQIYWPEATDNKVMYISHEPRVDEHFRSKQCDKLLKIKKVAKR
jgi:para-nitrobenzyl esterase